MTRYQKSFEVFTDPGHGWVKVPIALLRELKIADQITPFSYANYEKQTAFLEEDCDAATFVKTYEKHFGHAPNFLERHTNRDSRIRSLPAFNCNLFAEPIQ